ncbi:MAG TPA: type II toxin-antitoxin system VapC family toxin [Egibacteraceae bacterium]|nr:type II toxin-antitoxin system VapC family toxin [Egibacteraceae bacterium]
MTALVDTSVVVDALRGDEAAVDTMIERRQDGPLHASRITLVEVLAGMRPAEEPRTRELLATLTWHPLSDEVAEEAGRLGRRWLPSHSGIDTADLVVAATARVLGVLLLTRNVRHFPMFDGLRPPY